MSVSEHSLCAVAGQYHDHDSLQSFPLGTLFATWPHRVTAGARETQSPSSPAATGHGDGA